MKKIRARYAPSPTGLLHIGNARTALFNYLLAKHYDGDFIIRIEDTDTLRNVEGGEESQLKFLKWLGISWDEGPDVGGPFGPYHQLKRLDLYQKYAHDLLERGLAYKDFKDDAQSYAIRLKVPENKVFVFDDVIRGTLRFDSKDIEDWIILKDNGIPTYNFAVVIDDHFMEITHVFRGEEHITNTPKQMMVYEAFGWDIPKFGHMTLIVNEEGKKLSKRDTNTLQFIGDYQRLGYLPEAMFNFLCLLGWSPHETEELLSKETLIQLFDEHKLSSAPSYFDQQKLDYINSKYIKMLDVESAKQFLRPFLIEAEIDIKDEVWFDHLLLILKDRLHYGKEIVAYYHQFFHDDFKIDDTILSELAAFDYQHLIAYLMKSFESIDFNDADAIHQAIKDAGKALDIKGKALFMPVRIVTTGEAHGPSLPVSLLLLGKDKVFNRMKQILNKKGEAA